MPVFLLNFELLELYLFNFIVFTKVHLVAKGQRYDSLHEGFMFFEELNVFITILYTLETAVGRETVGKI